MPLPMHTNRQRSSRQQSDGFPSSGSTPLLPTLTNNYFLRVALKKLASIFLSDLKRRSQIEALYLLPSLIVR
jgi:hypothetical protein